ncbi:MAG: cation:proton antiporter [Candidatus Eisenbacteria bacterium]|nr:cation:proton antiporter [Candidatus Eisenbacteria bacterium]
MSADILPLLAALALILVAGRAAGAGFERIGQPAVLGELVAGIVLGNLGLAGVHALDGLRAAHGVAILAEIGVLLFLYRVGLETDLAEMMAVGASSLAVAVLGVITPMALGALVSAWWFPSSPPLVHAFVGATLTATSVGITARVLADLGRADGREGRIILGAAVIDDVLGLLVLTVVAGIIAAADHGRAFDALSAAWVVGKALLFLAAALVLGRPVSRAALRIAERLPGRGVTLVAALALCFGFAWLAGRVGLAPIVGAFAAGLVADPADLAAAFPARAADGAHHATGDPLEPIAAFLVPVFFVLMGLRVDLAALAQPGVLGFALLLTAVAVLGKQACALGVLEKGCDRIAVGLGMIPRGEVGLIFAGIGTTLTLGGAPVVSPAVFSAVVIMVALTTLATPPLLVMRLRARAPAR